ncbi:MAG: hypothetical protein M1831_006639 [Alyxoria varia]|nr:MAG: hypothetical protein M1831_006639 [Alyxoria varia]
MLFTYLITLAVVASLTNAAPPAAVNELQERASGPQDVLAGFDDLRFNPLLPQLNVIPRPYKGLCFDSFIGGNVSIATFIETRSAPNDIASDLTSRLNQPPTVSAASSSCTTPVKYFTAKSFYTGCAIIAANSEASVPSTCNLRITGTKRPQAGGGTVTQSFTYTPSKLIRPPMQKVPLSSNFNQLVNFKIEFTDVVNNAVQVLAADDIATKQFFA